MHKITALLTSALIETTHGTAFAADAANPPSDTLIAAKLTECHAGLTAYEGMMSMAGTKFDREEISGQKAFAKQGSIALVGHAKAKEAEEATKERMQTELTAALVKGPQQAADLIDRYLGQCISVLQQQGALHFKASCKDAARLRCHEAIDLLLHRDA
jgi:hypothetical protein